MDCAVTSGGWERVANSLEKGQGLPGKQGVGGK
jgi:hypothetical protein